MADKTTHRPNHNKDHKRAVSSQPQQRSQPTSREHSQGSEGTMSTAVDRAARQVGERMVSLAHDYGTGGTGQGALASSSSALAGAVEQAGQYLKDHGLEGFNKDCARMVKEYPVASVLVGVFFGFMLGATLPSTR